MYKKLLAACMAVAALAAFGMASTASAAPFLTQPTGTALATGTTIVGTNVGNTLMTTSLGTVTCTSAKLEGKLTTNSTASGSKGEVTSAAFNNCTSWAGSVTVTPNPATNGLPWCLEATEANDNGKVRGGGCSSASRAIRFVLDFPGFTCTYQRTSAAAGTVTTDTSGQQASVTLSEQEWPRLEGDSFLCPSSGKLDMTFTLETSNGAATYFSS